MGRDELLQEALYLISEYNVTAYEIEKNTSLTAVGVQKIINGESKRPLENTLKTIISYIKDNYSNNSECSMLKGTILAREEEGEKQDQKHTEGTEVLILPVSAEGGRLDGFSTQVRTEDCETIISPIKDVDFAMTVSGDSMYPEYPSGSKILVKKINEKAFIDWGRVYVLDTCNGAVIKKIMPGSTEDKVKCLSINEEYPPFEVAFNDIFGMYRVLMCMSLK